MLGCLLPACAGAATLRDVSVVRADGVYKMHSEVWFDASAEQMYGVFSDWDLSTKFSSIVVESRNLEADDLGRPGFYSRIRACVWIFCKSFERYGVVEIEPQQLIVAIADPERSDFYVSTERWEIIAEDEGTLVIYDLEMKPKFFIPPFIGPAMMKRKLKSGGTNAVDRIEAIAQAWPDVE